MTKKGSFSTVKFFDHHVEVDSCDPVKECMSLGWFPEHRLFPRVEFLRESRRDDHKVYRMERYEQPRSIKSNVTPRQWRLYRELRSKLNHVVGVDNLRASLSCLSPEFKEEREALEWAVDALCNYGDDMVFEISPRNVAVKGRKLILLDCFFMQGKLLEMW